MEKAKTPSLKYVNTFGEVAAEDDPVLEYFLETDAVRSIQDNRKFLVLGRKGAGKTAIVRYFSETANLEYPSRALKFQSYPWSHHASLRDYGASSIECYIASWRYLIAVQIGSLIVNNAPEDPTSQIHDIEEFLQANYGDTTLSPENVITKKTLKLSGIKVAPTFAGTGIGEVSLSRQDKDSKLGFELRSITDALLELCAEVIGIENIPGLLVHFDELDQGLSKLDERDSMLVGLILAARDVRTFFRSREQFVNPVVYLRTDLWSALSFPDKNKLTESSSLLLEWNTESLKSMVELRLQAKINGPCNWDDFEDSKLMRGSQSKWNHIVARSFLRPRDIIKFLNAALEQANMRNDEPLVFINEDITNARDSYSKYLKRELEDEIYPHWSSWETALQALSEISTITFDRGEFAEEYERRRGNSDPSTDDALQLLFDFSAIGYETRSGYGGSGWIFSYEHPESGWDKSASRFKVHLGLKEVARLREERK